MYRGKKISITIPVYNEENHIEEVIQNIPDIVDFIIIVDDASSDKSWEKISKFKDERIHTIRHEVNQGVGKSTLDGHNLAIKLGSDILVRIDGDCQMDLNYLEPLITPLFDDDIHFTKGNRLKQKKMRQGMPKFRLFGNLILTKMTQIMTGYYQISDPQNGYTAIKAEIFKKLNQKKIKTDYIYENSILFELSEINANIVEVDMHSKYGKETSSIIYPKFIVSMITYFLVCLVRRFIRGLKRVFRVKKK
ncbi:MAG: glycosyltransferase family 2 protein [Candidatus Heimdallarchaeaceae archaeon]